jgi:hypothetical protein
MGENPYEAPQTAGTQPRRGGWPNLPEPHNTVACVLAVLVIVAILAALLLPSVQMATSR